MGFRSSMEAPAFDNPGKAPSLTKTDHVHPLTDLKLADIQFLANFQAFHRIQPEFLEILEPALEPVFFKVPAQRFGQFFQPFPDKSKLHCVIPVGGRGFFCTT